MKNLIMCLISLFVLTCVQGQTPVTLTFQAKDSLTQTPIGLDSVNIRNLTENCDTTLYDSISILNLLATWPVGIDQEGVDYSGSFFIMPNVPNPFQGSTTARIYLKDPGELRLAVYNISGNCLSVYNGNFVRGLHQFSVSSKLSQVLFLKVSDKTTAQTIKISCIGEGSESERITYNGQTGEGLSLKSTLDVAGFNFYLGNQLKFTAYVNGYQSSVLTDDPVVGATYTFAMLPDLFTCGNIVSYSGQNYTTILIGGQCWFKENLNVGSRINGTQMQANNSVIEKFCYGNLESNCDLYGGLYQWDEAMQYITTEGVKGICPDGWHIPTNAEYTVLSDFLGGNNVAGGKMKETGFTYWWSPNTGATNSSGFTALAGGLRDPMNFSALQQAAYFWTSTLQSMDEWFYSIGFDGGILYRYGNSDPVLGISLRCMKD